LLVAALRHASCLEDQVCEHTKKRKDQQKDNPERFAPAGYVVTPKQVAKHQNEQPEPYDEKEYCKDVGQKISERKVSSKEHGDPPCVSCRLWA
jgi:hypothetical protein